MATYPVKRAAVIGAGISGVVSAAHLLKNGVEVTVFERNKAAGGVWLYDERLPIEPLYPATEASAGEELGEDLRKEERHNLEHAPPGPCYDGLTNNVATRLMRVKLNAWPEGTPDYVNHDVMEKYVQDNSKKSGVDDVTIYGARVSEVRKTDSVWQVNWSTLQHDSQTGVWKEEKNTASFDAVVVASGHYHAPRIPDIPGLSNSKAKWPTRIWHSKRYRRPNGFEGKNVLLIGGGVSSADIAKELGPVAKEIYQSSRNGAFDLPASILPENGVRVSEIVSFEAQENHDPAVPLDDDEPLPLVVTLKSGQKLCGIHVIIICTGYHITLPFLREYHEDQTHPSEASDTVLVTDGTQVHNLHKDIFYIPDPTLAFVGVPYYTATFTLFEFQAIVVAAVFSGRATLPERTSLKEEYEEKLKQKGAGKMFHSLKDKEEEYVIDLLRWINEDGAARGIPSVEGHTPSWLEAKKDQIERLKQIFGNPDDDSVTATLPPLPACA